MNDEKKPGRPPNVEVIAIRKIGVEDKREVDGVRMVNPGETVSVPRAVAKKLQDAGAVKVAL